MTKSETDKRTFIHRSFTVPKLKKAASKMVDWDQVQQYTKNNYDVPEETIFLNKWVFWYTDIYTDKIKQKEIRTKTNLQWYIKVRPQPRP